MGFYIKKGRAKNLSENHKNKISLGLKRHYAINPVSEETKRKISQSNIGRTSANKGKRFSKETRLKMSIAQRGENNANWKTGELKYSTVHKWIVRTCGRADHCVNGHKAKKYDWANKTGEYKRDINDWHQLCRSCNMKDGVRMKNGS